MVDVTATFSENGVYWKLSTFKKLALVASIFLGWLNVVNLAFILIGY